MAISSRKAHSSIDAIEFHAATTNGLSCDEVFWMNVNHLLATDVSSRNKDFVYATQIVYIFLLFCVTYFIFSYIGPANFADYLTYVQFKEQFGSETFTTEILTRYILSGAIVFSGLLNGADNLILFIYVWTAGFAVAAMRKDALLLHVFVIFGSIFFPFILTTGLRVAPVYPAFLMIIYCVGKGALQLRGAFLWLAAISLLFHDSVFLMLVVMLFAWILRSKGLGGAKFRKVAIIVSLVSIASNQTPLVALLVQVLESVLGARVVYIGGGIGNSLGASVYMIFLLYLTFLNDNDDTISKSNKTICCGILLLCCIVFPVAPVASVRLSHYLIIALIASRACIFTSLERSPSLRVLFIPGYFAIFCLQFTTLIIR